MKVLFKNGNMLRIEQNILMPEIKIDPYNPADLPAYSVRVKFAEGKSPVQHYIDDPDADPWVWPRPQIPDPAWHQTCIDEENNIWDIKYENSNWTNVFNGGNYSKVGVTDDSSILEIISGNLAGVTNIEGFLTDQKYTTKVIFNAKDAIYSRQNPYSSQYFLQRMTRLEELHVDLSSLSSLPEYWGNNVEANNLQTVEMKISSMTSIESKFQSMAVRTVILHDAKVLTNARDAFRSCNNLSTVIIHDMHNLDDARNMFEQCQSLHEMPDFDYSSIRYASEMFSGSYWDHPEYGLSSIRYVNMPNVVNVSGMFNQQAGVEHGALDMYNQLKDVQGITYSNCFGNCGGRTESGIQELIQIPSSWGGWGA